MDTMTAHSGESETGRLMHRGIWGLPNVFLNLKIFSELKSVPIYIN